MTSDLSSHPCRRCGERHQLRARPVGMLIMAAGRTGTVDSWSQYNSPLSVRVQFDEEDEYGFPIRESFAPCEVFPIALKATP